jgi:hypothetical protein
MFPPIRPGEAPAKGIASRAHGAAGGGRPPTVRSAIRDEVRRLAADERDREEMRIIREQLAKLAPPLSD